MKKPLGVLLLVCAWFAGCAAATQPGVTIQLETLNDSGVTGSVTLIPLGDRTQVDVDVDPAGHPDMPSHVHPGDCDNLVPQPKYPLRNVIDGKASTIIAVPLSELLAGDLAINLHNSNEDMRTYAACAKLVQP
jgi:uncharacterized protein YabE (DUF348 family)